MPIHALELISDSSAHSVGNQLTVLTIASAFPGIPLHMHGTKQHLSFWDKNLSSKEIHYHEIEISKHFSSQSHMVSLRRLLHDFRILRRVIATSPRNEPCLILLLYASSTAVHAAALLARLSRRRIFFQVGLHGNLNDALSWRSRNPLRRALDFVAAFQTRYPHLRYLVLENAVRDEMARDMPDFAQRCDVMSHPINTAEAAGWEAPRFEFPIRVGLVGQATEAKGITPFLQLAARLKARHGPKIEFHIVGSRPRESDPELFRDIAHPVPIGQISRAEFVARMAKLHYVLLPLNPSYYRLSPSGGLIDAVAWGKPILATPMPIVLDLFREGGDIGQICENVEAFEAALEDIITNVDGARHARQSANMLELAHRRTPEALAGSYRQQTLAAFPELIGSEKVTARQISATA